MINIDRLNDFSPAEVKSLLNLEIETLDDLWSFIGTDTYSGAAKLADQLQIEDPKKLALRLEQIALKEIELGPAIAFEHNRLLFSLWKTYFLLNRVTPWIVFVLVCVFLILRFL